MQKEIGWLLKEKYEGVKTSGFFRDVQRLNRGEPLDYVIGFTEFLGCKIDLSKKPLIPRKETEYWVSEEIKNIKSGKVLDVFAGSGCIGLAILKKADILRRSKNVAKYPLCDISDKDLKAISQIKINLKLNGVKGKVIKSDVFKNIKNKYDYIFANPPYIPTTRKNKIQKEVLKYEPKNALFGGADGLFYINKFLKDAKNHLNVGGKIFMEFDYIQKKEIEKLIKKYKYFDFEFKKDQFNKWRWVIVS